MLREVKAQRERAKSIILAAVFDDYVEKLRRMHRTENYIKHYRWCRSYFRPLLD